jgi:hypothetical protein
VRNTDLKFTTTGDYMATRSRIAMKLNDGRYMSIYAHWDGHPGTRGPILTENYTEYDSVMALMNMGDVSSLGVNFADTIFYNRDRHEELNYSIHDSYTHLLREYHSDEEYIYIFEKGIGWSVIDTYNMAVSYLEAMEVAA